MRTLVASGVDVSVLALGPREPEHDALVVERELEGVRIENGSAETIVRGLRVAAMRPRLALDLMGLLLRHSWRRPGSLLRGLLLVPSALAYFDIIEAERPDVVHLFWGHYPALVGHLVQRHLPDVVVSHFLGAYDLEYGFGPARPVIRRADAVWTHAAVNIPTIEALGASRDRLRVSYRGVDLRAGASGAAERIRHRIVTGGRLEPDKAVDDSLRVFQRVLIAWPDATMLILGKGRDRAALEDLARDLGVTESVEFGGQVPQKQLFEHLSRAEVFLLMSWAPGERLPNIVKEAALHGCPCVVTRTTGIDELIVDGEHGFTVDLHAIDLAAERVGTLLGDPGLRERLGAAAARRVTETFDVHRSMQLYRDTWEELCRQKKGSGRRRTCEP